MKPQHNKSAPTPTDWGDVADWYDQLVGEAGSEYHREVVLPGTLRLLAVQGGDHVLDLACGQGVLCRLLSAKNIESTGVDAAGELIRVARTRAAAIAGGAPMQYHIADARDLPFLKADHFSSAACVLAIQNMHPLGPVFSEVARVLKPGGKLVLVMMHPCFRGPKETEWGWDADKKVQYRRVDRYLIPRKTPIVTHPGKDPGKYTWSFHKPIESYVKSLRNAGLLIDAIEEWPSHKKSTSGPRAPAENVAREEIPMFMAVRALKAADKITNNEISNNEISNNETMSNDECSNDRNKTFACGPLFRHSNFPPGLPGRASPLQYPNLMESTKRPVAPSPPLVAMLGWVLPGGGYLLLGQYGRAMGVGITIILLFLMGLLIGGIRVIEVPGYDVATGDPVMTTIVMQAFDRGKNRPAVDDKGQPIYEPARDPVTGEVMKRWALQVSPLNEIRDKPWSVPQALVGPMAIVSGYLSVQAAGQDLALHKLDPATGKPITYGALSHSRMNEIGSLYLSVAGLLNLMAIIDSAWRASHMGERQSAQKEFA